MAGIMSVNHCIPAVRRNVSRSSSEDESDSNEDDETMAAPMLDYSGKHVLPHPHSNHPKLNHKHHLDGEMKPSNIIISNCFMDFNATDFSAFAKKHHLLSIHGGIAGIAKQPRMSPPPHAQIALGNVLTFSKELEKAVSNRFQLKFLDNQIRISLPEILNFNVTERETTKDFPSLNLKKSLLK